MVQVSSRKRRDATSTSNEMKISERRHSTLLPCGPQTSISASIYPFHRAASLSTHQYPSSSSTNPPIPSSKILVVNIQPSHPSPPLPTRPHDRNLSPYPPCCYLDYRRGKVHRCSRSAITHTRGEIFLRSLTSPSYRRRMRATCSICTTSSSSRRAVMFLARNFGVVILEVASDLSSSLEVCSVWRRLQQRRYSITSRDRVSHANNRSDGLCCYDQCRC
jgi:hypothetical protein